MTFRTLLLSVLLLALPGGPASAQEFPRLGMYGICTELGSPMLDASGNHDPVVLDALARYHQVILPVTPITPFRPDLAVALRARNPGIQLIAYVPGQNIWEARRADSTLHFPSRYRHLVDSLNAHLYNKQGQYHSYGRVNFAKRQGGRYVMAEAAANLFHEVVVGSGQWDGIFIDVLCSSIAFMESPAESVDFVRAGYPTYAAFDVAWGAAVDTLGDRLRRLSGPGFLMMGNCAQGTNYESLNGWMRENFPWQNGGTWEQNMFNDPGGYVGGDLKFRTPHHNYISTIPQFAGGAPYTAENARRVRFGLASAALGSGYGVFNEGAPSTSDKTYLTWWYDEYAVDLATGASSTQLQHTGWLGQTLGGWYQMIWVGTQPDVVTNPGFETSVTSGWTFGSGNGSTIARDPSTAAVGTASARIHVPTAGVVSWDASLATSTFMPVAANALYSATFWARASSSRPISVVLAPTSGSLATRTLAIDTTWRQYQIALYPIASGNVRLGFYLAAAAGDVWLDDCHLQAGATSIYRRDFQNGAVLVNPSTGALTVPLGREFRRIQGAVDPVVNNGGAVTQVTIPAADALFLIGDDIIPPGTILDLQPFIQAAPTPPDPQSSSPPRRP